MVTAYGKYQNGYGRHKWNCLIWTTLSVAFVLCDMPPSSQPFVNTTLEMKEQTGCALTL